ncbi:MAG: ATP-dependent sacrificial sulfur transferase LarE [Candidatus Omnitrophota bacterium]|nr:MAG: ATP-dependent sacrificial sulfur transferase LarE [Candidatus Omnitrophota bacterium]
MLGVSGKYNQLKRFLADLEGAVIAFSGGTDSGLLVKVAYDVLGRAALAVTAASAIHPFSSCRRMRKVCKEIGIKSMVIKTNELENKNFRRNLEDRCYWCKRNLILKLKDIAFKNKLKYILDGTNYDDKDDVRPGLKANNELGVISPLYECKFSKKDIIGLAKYLKLSFWNKPKGTCLASRIPFGEEITLTRIKIVEKAENILKQCLGVNSLVRARHHKDILRLELGNREWTKLKKSDINRITKRLKDLGYKYITVDLQGYVPAGKKLIS